MNRAERRADFLSRHRRAHSRAGAEVRPEVEPANPQTAPRAASLVESMTGNAQLRIEELVLHGFAPRDRYLIRDAAERELTRLFTERGVPRQMTAKASVARLAAGTINLEAGSKAQTVGAEIAGALYGGRRR